MLQNKLLTRYPTQTSIFLKTQNFTVLINPETKNIDEPETIKIDRTLEEDITEIS